MPSTTNTRRKNAAARTIQAAARAFLAKKYAYTQNGPARRLALNMITGAPIPKSRAIQLRSKNGIMRTWNARAVKSIVIGGKKVARNIEEYLPLVSASDRARIDKLAEMHVTLRGFGQGLTRLNGHLLGLIQHTMALIFILSVMTVYARTLGVGVLHAATIQMNIVRYVMANYFQMLLVPIQAAGSALNPTVVTFAGVSCIGYRVYQKLVIRNMKKQLRALASPKAVPNLTFNNIEAYKKMKRNVNEMHLKLPVGDQLLGRHKPSAELVQLLAVVGKRITQMYPRVLNAYQ